MKRYITLIILLSVFLSGCNILIYDNQVLPIEEYGDKPKTANVLELNTEQPGRVCSLSYDKNSILSIGYSNNMYTIDQFDTKTSTLVNITTSDTRVYDVQAAKLGFFYTKMTASSTNSIQIVWSSSDRLVERTITDTIDSPERAIYVYGDDRIAYINNSTELVLSDSNGVKNRYELSGMNLIATKIAWNPKLNIGFLIAQEPDVNNYKLYRIALEDEGVIINTIAKNVLDMDFDETNQKLVYAIQEDNAVQIYQIQGGDMTTSDRLFKTEDLSKLGYNSDGSIVYFSKPLENGVRSTIWRFSIDDRESIQISSPLRLNSPILAPDVADTLYFSANQVAYITDSELTQPVSYITELVYELEK